MIIIDCDLHTRTQQICRRGSHAGMLGDAALV
jgi:hypothetical protein